VQSWSGSAGVPNEAGTGIDMVATDAFALDFQAQGALGSHPLGVYVTHGNSAASAAGARTNLFNSKNRDRAATTLTAELGVSKTPRISVVGGYRSADNGGASTNKGDNALTLGANWMIAQNIGLHWVVNRYNGSAYASGQKPMKPGGTGRMMNTLMLSAGF
jgi:hypothetical protein